jgi:hypothetical protein
MNEEKSRQLLLEELFRQRNEKFVQVGKLPIVGIELVHEVFLALEAEGLVEFVSRPIPWPAWRVRLTPKGYEKSRWGFSSAP